MNVIQRLLTRHAENLEVNSKKLKKVREWAEGRRRVLDRAGPDATAHGSGYMNVTHFEDLEEILGTG